MTNEKRLEKLEETRDLLIKIKEIWGNDYDGGFDLIECIDGDLSELDFDIKCCEKEIGLEEKELFKEDPIAERIDRAYEMAVGK